MLVFRSVSCTPHPCPVRVERPPSVLRFLEWTAGRPVLGLNRVSSEKSLVDRAFIECVVVNVGRQTTGGSAPTGNIRSSPSFVAECADRELNPGYELGKLMSYH